MIKNENTIIEEHILEITNKVIQKWDNELKAKRIYVDPPHLNRSDGSQYFSEIEFDFWKNDQLEEPFSILIFVNNKQVLREEDTYEYINKEIEDAFSEII